ncbi:MAG TPA: pyruvate, water dikinase regulatory protein [Geobacterales bacterium]|nr:pyruvate, water dikinase regulatory protein [Geobacterales bacterium]
MNLFAAGGIFPIYILSDATGETVERVLRAALSQFQDVEIKLHRFSHLRSRADVTEALSQVENDRGIVIYTLVNTELARFLEEEAQRLEIVALDLITPLLYKLAEFFGKLPREKPGILYQLDAEYNRRVDAMNFAVKHDDGAEPRNLSKADLVLVGVSRTSKTPLSMYLANKGYKVANVPLVAGIDPPEELYELPPQKVIGLIIDAHRLTEIRTARLRNLRQDRKSSYAAYEQIEEELDFSRQIFRRNPGWTIIDVTNKAIEETASEVMKRVSSR